METFTIDGDTGRATLQSTRPSAAVVARIATAENVDETELPPLFHAIDPDALDALFESGRDGPGETRTSGSVTFAYAGYEVHVSANGSVDVTPQTSG